jgi:hypothetical protein
VVQAVLSGVVFASMSRALAQREEEAARRHLEDGARFALLLIAPAAALLSVDADGVVALLFGAGYGPAGDILRWQLVAFALLPLLDLCFMAMAADGRPGYPAWLLAALIAPALVLVNSHGGAGAAAAQDRRGHRDGTRRTGDMAALSDAGAAPHAAAGRLRDRLDDAALSANFGHRPAAGAEARRSAHSLAIDPCAAQRGHVGGPEALRHLEPGRCVSRRMSKSVASGPACWPRP